MSQAKNKGKQKVIDYLSEDPPISGQKFALVSIVGPHMPQKCDVWGMKIRGVADSVEKAKSMSKRLITIDEQFDIFTVEVGKFFPLVVEPNEVDDVEYQNEQLNMLVKSYMENRQHANEQWHERKNKMVQDAIREGKNKEELLNKKEHPVAVLQRVHVFKDKINNLQSEIDSIKKDLDLTQEKYDSYDEEERKFAEEQIEYALKNGSFKENNIENDEKSEKETTESVNENMNSELKNIVEQLQNLDSQISDKSTKLNSINTEHSPNLYEKLSKEISEIQEKREALKQKLTDSNLVNEYINQNYENSEYDQLLNNVSKN